MEWNADSDEIGFYSILHSKQKFKKEILKSSQLE